MEYPPLLTSLKHLSNRSQVEVLVQPHLLVIVHVMSIFLKFMFDLYMRVYLVVKFNPSLAYAFRICGNFFYIIVFDETLTSEGAPLHRP